MQAPPKGTSRGHSRTIAAYRNRNGTPWAPADPHMNVHIRATRLQGWKVGQDLSVSEEIKISLLSFCLIPSLYIINMLFSFTGCVCIRKHPSSLSPHQPQYHPFHLLIWIFFLLPSHIGLNDTFGRDSQMYIRIERGRKWPSRWVFMHYRSLYKRPESHSATINQDEGPTGPLPARK